MRKGTRSARKHAGGVVIPLLPPLSAGLARSIASPFRSPDGKQLVFFHLPTLPFLLLLPGFSMLSRLNLLTRHFARPFSSIHPATPTPSLTRRSGLSAMTSATHPKPIHTAACLIIGDEVLGGKVSNIYTSTSIEDGADHCPPLEFLDH